MTGFARVRRTGEPGEITATVKSVNHRALDLHIHIPAELEEFEPALRQVARKHVARGHVDLRLSFLPAHAAGAAGLNRPLFESYLQALEDAAGYGLEAKPDVNSALRIPGMLALPQGDEAPPGLEALVLETAEEALAALDRFRLREGAETVTLLLQLNAAIRRDAELVGGMRGEATAAIRNRLSERLKELIESGGMDPQRLAQEAALLADRSDIAEEISRLQVHSRELDALLTKGGEIGKKLDFLMQEMNRETNTILSKTSGLNDLGLQITTLGLEIKANVERIREQALNIE
jgi:uncharacterized protein (TIGR00255 family)